MNSTPAQLPAIETQAHAPAPASPMLMLHHALERGQSPEMIERLMDLAERWNAGENRKAFERAMSQAQGAFKPITKSKRVDFTTQRGRTNYAHETLGDIEDAVKDALSANGLSYRWRTDQGEGGITCTCIVTHHDGHAEETTLRAPADQSGSKNGIQAIQSTITYLQRATVKAALGLSSRDELDDDGRAAGAAAAISNAALENIIAKAIDLQVDMAALCKHFAVGDLRELRAEQESDVWAALQKKEAQRAQRNAESQP